MCCEHLKHLLRVICWLNRRVNWLCHSEYELCGEAVGEHIVSAFASLRDDNLVWIYEVRVESEQVFRLFGLHWRWVRYVIDHIELKTALHWHLLELIDIKLVMPSVPQSGELGALLGLEIFKSIIVFFSDEFEEEWLMRVCRAFFIVLNRLIAYEMINEVFQRHARIITLQALKIVVFWLPNIFESRLHSLSTHF